MREIHDFKSMVSRFLSKGNNNKILIMFCVGLMILCIIPSSESNKSSSDKNSNNAIDSNQVVSTLKNINNDDMNDQSTSYVNNEEEKVTAFLKNFDGVIDAKVIISKEYGKEKILAKNIESDKSQNTQNEIDSVSETSKNITYKENIIYGESDNPYVVKEKEETVKGVVVLIKGNYSAQLEKEVLESMKAYFDISINKIKVYKMKG